MLSLDQFRARFPIFRQRVYLNSCSQGALSTDVEQAITAFTDSWHTLGSPWELWAEQVEVFRAAFARAVGVDADEIAVMPSASAGVNAIASALSFSSSRRNVVMSRFEFPTVGQIWLAQQRHGAEIRWVETDGEELRLSSFERAVDERTLIVPATHVCYRNGFKTDIANLVPICRAQGAYIFLDDYQRSGSGPINVRQLGVDFMVTGNLKYLLGVAGVALLYVRRDLIPHLEPTITGWFGRENPFAFRVDELDWPLSARRFQSGTPPVADAYAGLAALNLLNEIGYDVVERRVAALVERFITGAHRAGYLVKTPLDAARRGPLVVVKSTDAAQLVARLEHRGIITSCRADGLRVSFHAYNNEDDVDTILGALQTEASLLVRADQLSPASR